MFGVREEVSQGREWLTMYRFPYDFMFQLTKEEFANLRFQFETSRWSGIRLMRKYDKGYKLLFFLVVFLGLAYVGVEVYQNPRYEIEATVDTAGHIIRARQKVTLVNNSEKSVKEAYFHIYPNRKYTEKEKRFISRYAAYFKVNLFPEGFQSGSLKINSVSSSGQSLKYQIEGEDRTILKVELEKEVVVGSSAVLELEYQVEIPHAYGRFGRNKNITSLLRWYPMLSVLDKEGWHNYPFYPYHQPYFSEAALYSVKLTVPGGEVVIHSGILKSEARNADGSKTIFLESELPLRDFGLALSPDYKVQS